MNQPQIPTYQAGTILTVGSHKVRIIKYLTSGGYAQIYSCEVSPPDTFIGSNVGCLKRVIVPDKPSLNTLRAEVDAMKLLRGNKHVVSYIDSHAAKSNLQDGSYEVFLLMEFCERGGLIDFLNTRLQNRLTEQEVLDIFIQVCQGVASMHALQPPLIHRDIKIENVLISRDNSYKLCDFGSVCGVVRPPNNAQELAVLRNDILKNTTAQYRAPEMLDLTSGLPIDEKSDIWALGVLLYKLCYYTTPFEKHGEQAIILGIYEYPAYPQYSDAVKHLIRWSLMPDPNQRPNIYQLVEYTSQLLHIPCPIIDFYTERASGYDTSSLLGPAKIGFGASEPLVGRFGQQLQQQRQQQGQNGNFVAAGRVLVTDSGNLRKGRNNTGTSTKSQPELHAIRRQLSQNSQRSLRTPRAHETQKPQEKATRGVYAELDISTSSSEDSIINSINLPPRLRHLREDVTAKEEEKEEDKLIDLDESPPSRPEESSVSQQSVKNAIAEARIELDTNRSAIAQKDGSLALKRKPSVMQRAELYGGAINSSGSGLGRPVSSVFKSRTSPLVGYRADVGAGTDESSQESELSSDDSDSGENVASYMDISATTDHRPKSEFLHEEITELEEKYPPIEPEHEVETDRSKNQLTKELLRQRMREKLNKTSSAFEIAHRTSTGQSNKPTQRRSVLVTGLRKDSESKLDSQSEPQTNSVSSVEAKEVTKPVHKPKPKLPPKPSFLAGKKKVPSKE